MNLYQIYFREDQIPNLDSDFIPYDNTDSVGKPSIDWTWDVYRDLYEKHPDEYWGTVSWKFKQKTNLTGKQFKEFIEANPGYDCYIVNGAIADEAVFVNGWEQSLACHGTEPFQIATDYMKWYTGMDINLTNILLTRNMTSYAGFVYASPRYWNAHFAFMDGLFKMAEMSPEYHDRLFKSGTGNYELDSRVTAFAVIHERMVSTTMLLNNFKTITYKYDDETVAERFKPFFEEIDVISTLKDKLILYPELQPVWRYYRSQFIDNNPRSLKVYNEY